MSEQPSEQPSEPTSQPTSPPGHEPLQSAARALFASALAECSIANAMARSVRIEAGAGASQVLQIGEHTVDLAGLRRVCILAVGKAAHAMLEAVLSLLPTSLELQGILIAPTAPRELPPAFQFFAGGHPVPSAASMAGARAALAMLEALAREPEGQLCLFLISGGASAMLELPLDAAISLEDAVAFHQTLVHSGASIEQINCVRKHFSAVKGGRLGQIVKGAMSVTILVSDVPDGRIDTIGSGPTVADPSTVEDCRGILQRYALMEQFPAAVRQFFASPDLPETPKPGEFEARTLTLLNSSDLAQAAARHAERLGFRAVIDNTCDDWDYRAAADYLLARVRGLRRVYSRVCLISVGEVTVEAANPRLFAAGSGGRNQHFALYAATRLEASDAPMAVLSAGSDGVDGSSSAAGAVVSEGTLHGARYRLAAREALRQFRSAPLLESLGCAIHTGPTGNNLRDLRLILAE